MRQRRFLMSAFADHAAAAPAVEELRAAGVPADRINVLLPDREETRQLFEEGPKSPGKGAKRNVIAGAILFGIVGLAVGALEILPGGALLVGAIGAVLGVALGALLGAVVGLGIPRHEAVLREKAIRDSGVIVGVRFEEDVPDESKLRQVLERHHPKHVFRV